MPPNSQVHDVVVPKLLHLLGGRLRLGLFDDLGRFLSRPIGNHGIIVSLEQPSHIMPTTLGLRQGQHHLRDHRLEARQVVELIGLQGGLQLCRQSLQFIRREGEVGQFSVLPSLPHIQSQIDDLVDLLTGNFGGLAEERQGRQGKK